MSRGNGKGSVWYLQELQQGLWDVQSKAAGDYGLCKIWALLESEGFRVWA